MLIRHAYTCTVTKQHNVIMQLLFPKVISHHYLSEDSLVLFSVARLLSKKIH